MTTPATRTLLSAKIHKATVTHADVAYVGSITIGRDLCEKVDLWPGERVLVVSNTSGARLETYVLLGEAGMIKMNGAAAHLINVADEVIIMAFQQSEHPIEAKQILVGPDNHFLHYLVA